MRFWATEYVKIALAGRLGAYGALGGAIPGALMGAPVGAGVGLLNRDEDESRLSALARGLGQGALVGGVAGGALGGGAGYYLGHKADKLLSRPRGLAGPATMII